MKQPKINKHLMDIYRSRAIYVGNIFRIVKKFEEESQLHSDRSVYEHYKRIEKFFADLQTEREKHQRIKESQNEKR